jgi:hypothetical protein
MDKVLKTRQFTQEEDTFLIENCELLTAKELSQKLNRRSTTVRNRLTRFNLTPKSEKSYSDNECSFVEDNFNKYSYSELAEIMGISHRRVELIGRQLGLKRRFNSNVDSQTEVICSMCKNSYPKDNNYFYFKKDGTIYSTKCKPCAKKKSFKINSTLKGHVQSLLRGAKSRNKNCNIDYKYIIELYEFQNKKCAITGIELTHLRNGVKNLTNISIDRIDSNVGYIKGNIQLVCTWANLAKTSLSMEDFKNFIDLTFVNLNNKNNAKDTNN